MTKVARVGSKLATAAARAKAQAIFAARKPDGEPDRSREIASVADVAKELGSMRGVMAKFGQMLSYVSTPLDSSIRSGLSSLQDQAPPMSNDLVEEVFAQEFGKPPTEIFETWDPDPIASASIGQVHRAITADGEAVAVKVQYPGIRDTLFADLANLRVIARAFRFAFPAMDTDSIVAEISARIAEELDYEREAANQQRFADFYDGHPFIRIPGVRHDLTSSRVLVTELAAGLRFAEFLREDQRERDLAGETIFRFVFRSLYKLQCFNGDPHPGNYLFDGDGRVTFIDFGMTKYFVPDDISTFEEMVSAAVIQRSPAPFRAAIVKAGLLAPGCTLSDEQVYRFFEPFYESIATDAEFTFSESYTTSLFAHMFDKNDPVAKFLQVSEPFVVIQRINLGLYSILASLSATANFRRISAEIWPFTRYPASTELGRREADWLSGR
ncbi:MAG: AarF/ABC1/UbiB kinase family protein [Actinomycetota bacterium]|nr:AarF/ABC1/UbiB kinase family protein [Actinomycetota bacterium]MDA8209742.1 AarF/ABC1/UbiB kinase family protein [Actinomycetota bacterium]